MSKNIVDCVIEMKSDKLGLLPSRRQIDYDGGYVNNWNTKSFSEYVKERSNIIIERDHSGIGQGDKMNDEYISFKEDLKYFDIIHIDPWKEFQKYSEGVDETIKNIKFIHGLNKNIRFEIGTEESIRSFNVNEIDYFISNLYVNLTEDEFDSIEYVCIQSGVGLDLMNKKNTGEFNIDKLTNMISICKKYNKKTKEHNGDYLSENDFKTRFKNGLDSINIGPEIAQIETEIYLQNMDQNEIDIFYDICIKSKKWEKWITPDFNIGDKKKLIQVCGHYNFSHLKMDYADYIIKEEINKKLKELLSYV